MDDVRLVSHRDDRAVLSVEAHLDGEDDTSEVNMLCENGNWKVQATL